MLTNIHANKKIIAMDYVMILLEYLSQRDINADEVLQGTGISEAAIVNKAGFLSVAQYSALLENAQEHLKDPVLGLRLGQLQHIASHGPLGYAILSSKTMDDALNQVCRFIRIRNNLTRIYYERATDEVILRMEVDLPLGPLYQFIVEQSFSSFIYIVMSLSGLNSMQFYTQFCYAQPENSDFYNELFGVQSQFSAATNEIRIKRCYLTEFKLSSDPMFALVAEQQCQHIMAGLDRDEGIVAEIYQILSKSTGNFPAQAEVAIQLNISARSLVRKLSEQGTSFSEIVRNRKFELAKHYLSTTQWSCEEIAFLLNYESSGNFSRSFKKWAGISPSVYRIQLKNV